MPEPMLALDLDDEPDRPDPSPRGRLRGRAVALLVVALLVVVTAVVAGVDQRNRSREFEALLSQMTQAQSAIQYSYGRIQAMVQYTSPQLTSPGSPERVRAGLRQIVQQAVAERVPLLHRRRAAVAELSPAFWHGDQRRAQDACLAYLDQQIDFLQSATTDLRVLYRSPSQQPRAAARAALLAVSPDAATSTRIRLLLP
jgi:Tfp pilus assembly protein PilX